MVVASPAADRGAARPAAGDQLQSLLGLIQRRVRMRHPPLLWESAEISAPIATGVVGNHILLPEGWARTLGGGELFAVLCHESAHLARRDHRVVILQELLASAFWFHPLVHLFNRALNRVREEVCDNYAITMVERLTYCEALLRLAVERPGRRRAAPSRCGRAIGPSKIGSGESWTSAARRGPKSRAPPDR